MAEHYVCTGGCHGVSEKPCNCQVKTCRKHGLPLLLCVCTDGKHGFNLAPEDPKSITEFKDK